MKRLVFCFDGSWNQIDAPYPTNVLFTAEGILPMAADGTAQTVYYDEGVGTEQGEKLSGGVFGRGLEKNLNDAYRFLIFNHAPGDQIYVFGFSRGAFTARSFAGLIANCGILGRRHIGKVNELLARYRHRQDSEQARLDMMRYRGENCLDTCVSEAEDEWRAANLAGYSSGQAPLLRIRYVGVWDTVGALGIPEYVLGASLSNRKYQFHDCALSAFVESARHAVAIDEHKLDFRPTLWTNLPTLNAARGAAPDAVDAPYQEKWFPGNHGSVGGGGDQRGLSDHALDWIWDGAQAAGLRFDISRRSHSYELAPSEVAPLVNMTAKPGLNLLGWIFGKLPMADRAPGPERLHEVSVAARRRWHRKPDELPEGVAYRPRTLAPVQGSLEALDAETLGVDIAPIERPFDLHVLERDETLPGLAVKYYHDAELWPRIFAANRHKLDAPDRIHVGQCLRIPASA